jgi:hypothetical protein
MTSKITLGFRDSKMTYEIKEKNVSNDESKPCQQQKRNSVLLPLDPGSYFYKLINEKTHKGRYH